MLTDDIKKYRAILNEDADPQKDKADMLVKYFKLYKIFSSLMEKYDIYGDPNEEEYEKYPDLHDVHKKIIQINNEAKSSFGDDFAQKMEEFIENSVFSSSRGENFSPRGEKKLYSIAQSAGIDPSVFYNTAKGTLSLKNPDPTASTFDATRVDSIIQAQKYFEIMSTALKLLADPNVDEATRQKAIKAFKHAKSKAYYFSI